VAVSAGAVSLTGTWQTLQNYTANLTNIPAPASYVYHYRRVPDSAGFYSMSQGPISGATISLSSTVPVGSSAVAQTYLQRSTDSAQQTFSQVIAGNALAYNLDIGANLLPWFQQPTLDPATGIIKIVSDGTGTGDLFRVGVGYSRINTATNTTDRYHWVVYGATAGDITLPQLPSELGDLNPTSTDAVENYQGEVEFVDADTITGYDVVRAHACEAYLGWANYGAQGMVQLLRISNYLQPG